MFYFHDATEKKRNLCAINPANISCFPRRLDQDECLLGKYLKIFALTSG